MRNWTTSRAQRRANQIRRPASPEQVAAHLAGGVELVTRCLGPEAALDWLAQVTGAAEAAGLAIRQGGFGLGPGTGQVLAWVSTNGPPSRERLLTLLTVSRTNGER